MMTRRDTRRRAAGARLVTNVTVGDRPLWGGPLTDLGPSGVTPGATLGCVPDAVVIGAGPNGLVAANLLADAGWSVDVLEGECEPGGAVRSGETCEPGFVHDRFSSYPFAMISPALMGFGLEEFGLRWRRAPLVLAHVRPSDGTAAVLSQDLEETCERLDDPTDARAWRVLMERWGRIESAFAHTFFTPFPPVVGTARLAGRRRTSSAAKRAKRSRSLPSRLPGGGYERAISPSRARIPAGRRADRPDRGQCRHRPRPPRPRRSGCRESSDCTCGAAARLSSRFESSWTAITIPTLRSKGTALAQSDTG